MPLLRLICPIQHDICGIGKYWHTETYYFLKRAAIQGLTIIHCVNFRMSLLPANLHSMFVIRNTLHLSVRLSIPLVSGRGCASGQCVRSWPKLTAGLLAQCLKLTLTLKQMLKWDPLTTSVQAKCNCSQPPFMTYDLYMSSFFCRSHNHLFAVFYFDAPIESHELALTEC